MSELVRISSLERALVEEVLDSQFRTSKGSQMCSRLEKRFAEKFGVRFAVSFINGTATMHAALVAAGVGPGDEVIVPPLTMASTTFAVLHAGAMPIFADVDPRTWNLDPNSVAERITDRTSAIIPVSLYGLPPEMDDLNSIATQHNLFVLEDDAECFLATYKGKLAGTLGDAASFSFQSSKHITSGEGGMVITDDEDLADKMRRFGSLGYAGVGSRSGKISKLDIQSPDYSRHVSIGFNYRMPELCAAVALGQVERLDEFVAMRRRVADLYDQVIADCDWLIPQFVPKHAEHSYWTYAIRLDPESGVTWNAFRNKYLEFGGDGIYAAWKLTYLEPFLRGKRLHSEQWQEFEEGLCPIAESLQPYLLQFKTNYFSLERATEKVEALRKTIQFFN